MLVQIPMSARTEKKACGRSSRNGRRSGRENNSSKINAGPTLVLPGHHSRNYRFRLIGSLIVGKNIANRSEVMEKSNGDAEPATRLGEWAAGWRTLIAAFFG